jgi:hypothetical protein
MKSTNEKNELKDWFLQQKKLFESGLLTDEQVCCLASLARKLNIPLHPPRNMFESKSQKIQKNG